MTSNIQIPKESFPSYFREHGWHKDLKAWSYITWTFSICHPFKTKYCSYLELDPYEFVDCHYKRYDEIKLTDAEVLRIKKKLIKDGLLEKVKSKSVYRTLVYRWNIIKFAAAVEDNPKITPIYEGWKYVGGENV